jgi:hypothetical protein
MNPGHDSVSRGDIDLHGYECTFFFFFFLADVLAAVLVGILVDAEIDSLEIVVVLSS